MAVKSVTRFGIQRKIVANMTTESWQNIPHVSYQYEPDITKFYDEFKKTMININNLYKKYPLETFYQKVTEDGVIKVLKKRLYDSYKGQVSLLKEIGKVIYLKLSYENVSKRLEKVTGL